MFQNSMIRGLAVLLVFALCGGPEAAQAWAQQTSPGNTPDAAQQQQTSPGNTPEATQPQQTSPGNTPDGAQPAQPLPDAPSAQQQQQKKKPEAPLGTAAAKASPTAGGAASRPAGNAIAPAHQRQVRSLLIKIGAIAAGGAALGLVYALSRGTSSTPPGTR